MYLAPWSGIAPPAVQLTAWRDTAAWTLPVAQPILVEVAI